jgi:hypothetical protein
VTVFSSLLVVKKNLSKGVVAVLAAFLVGQFYFVRELLAAELFLALGFAILLVLGGLVYLVGSVCVCGLRGIGARRAVVSGTSEELVGSHSTIKGVHAPSF